jgi:hypothetical protein
MASIAGKGSKNPSEFRQKVPILALLSWADRKNHYLCHP